MSDTKPAKSSDHRLAPPYIAWKTFAAYAASLKGVTVPHTLDGSVRPVQHGRRRVAAALVRASIPGTD